MKQYPQADSPEHDSVEFMLLNLVDLYINHKTQMIRVVYWRVDHPMKGELTDERLNQTAPGLYATIFALATNNRLNRHEIIHIVTAMAAYMFDSYYSLKDAGLSSAYSFITGPTHISSGSKPASFVIDCVRFNVHKFDNLNIPSVEISPTSQLVVNTNVMEYFWPGSTRNIPIMESLGYSHDAIVDVVCNGIALPQIPSELPVIEFD